MAAYSKGGKKGELNLAGDWKKISAAFGNSPKVKALNSKIKASLKNAPKAMGHTEKAQLGKIKELEAQTKKEAKQIKKLQSKKSNDVAALAKDLKQFKSEFREMKSHIAKHIKTPYAKAHGHAAGGKPQTATLKKGSTTLKVKKVKKAPRVKKVTKAQVSKTKALRAKARAVLRKEGKAIPKILKKGSLDKMMKQKRVQTTPELGENDEFNSKDLDSEAKGLKADLDRIAKHTDMKHLHAASAIAEVTITDDEVAKAKREAQKMPLLLALSNRLPWTQRRKLSPRRRSRWRLMLLSLKLRRLLPQGERHTSTSSRRSLLRRMLPLRHSMSMPSTWLRPRLAWIATSPP